MQTDDARRGPAESGDARTRDRVLAAITELGPVTAGALAASLGLTATGVRRHLDQLAETGHIVRHESADTGGRRGRGRPARMWVVGDAGHETMASDYDVLAADAVRFLREHAGDAAVRAFADQRVSDLEGRYAERLVGAHGSADRATELVEALREDGFAASARPVTAPDGRTGLGVQLCQGHCPVQHVASEAPELCEAETDAFSRLLGVHVQRLATLAQGDHVCTTYIPTAAPSTSTTPPIDPTPTGSTSTAASTATERSSR